MKHMRVWLLGLIFFSALRPMENTLIRRRLQLQEEHRINGYSVHNYVETTFEHQDIEEDEFNSWKSSLCKNFFSSDMAKASILLLIAGVTTWSSTNPSATSGTSQFYNQTTMCRACNCADEKSKSFKQGMIYCSLGMSALLCCKTCIQMCRECQD